MERKPTNYKAFEPTAMRGPNLDPDSNKLLKKNPKLMTFMRQLEIETLI